MGNRGTRFIGFATIPQSLKSAALKAGCTEPQRAGTTAQRPTANTARANSISIDSQQNLSGATPQTPAGFKLMGRRINERQGNKRWRHSQLTSDSWARLVTAAKVRVSRREMMLVWPESTQSHHAALKRSRAAPLDYPVATTRTLATVNGRRFFRSNAGHGRQLRPA